MISFTREKVGAARACSRQLECKSACEPSHFFSWCRRRARGGGQVERSGVQLNSPPSKKSAQQVPAPRTPAFVPAIWTARPHFQDPLRGLGSKPRGDLPVPRLQIPFSELRTQKIIQPFEHVQRRNRQRPSQGRFRILKASDAATLENRSRGSEEPRFSGQSHTALRTVNSVRWTQPSPDVRGVPLRRKPCARVGAASLCHPQMALITIFPEHSSPLR